MRALITTFGSRGDLNPFVALARALRERRHEVTWAVEDALASDVRSAGFADVRHLTGDVQRALAPAQHALYQGGPIGSLRVIFDRYILPTLDAKVADLRDVVDEVDLVVAPPPHFAAAIAAERGAKPWATVVLSPAALPSAGLDPHPLPFAVPPSLQRLSNRLLWGLGELALRRVADGPVNAARRRYGLPTHRGLLAAGGLSPALAALAMSPSFIARQPDWPRQVQVTGFCFWDGAGGWNEPGELTGFLDDASSPIVAMSVGSSAGLAGEMFAPSFVATRDAVRAIGARLLAIGAPPEAIGAPARDVLAIPFAPFSRVYPRCAAVVHHGGVGTIAQALRAGVPMLILPWGADQFMNAGLVTQAGLGTALSLRRYRAPIASLALRDLLENEKRRTHARRLADAIAREDGARALCEVLEQLVVRWSARQM